LLVVARAVQGVGAAIVAPASLSIITARLAEGPQRTRALGLYGATASIGFVAGQVLGGVLVQYTSWRLIFLVNVPVGIAAAALAPGLITSVRRSSKSTHLDVTGGILITLAVAAGVFAISEAPVLGWFQPFVLAALVLAALAMGSFVVVERVQTAPLIDLSLLRRRGLRTAAILTFVMGACTAGELVVLSVYLQQALHDSPLAAGLVIAPQGVVGFLTGMFGARLVGRIGMRALLVAATASMGVGFLILAHLPSSGHYSPVFFAVVLVGFGRGHRVRHDRHGRQRHGPERPGIGRWRGEHHSPSWCRGGRGRSSRHRRRRTRARRRRHAQRRPHRHADRGFGRFHRYGRCVVRGSNDRTIGSFDIDDSRN
jgi:MFS family permease